MCVKEHQPLVDGCCTFCCKAVDFGTHDYCGNNYACPRSTSSATVPLKAHISVSSPFSYYLALDEDPTGDSLGAVFASTISPIVFPPTSLFRLGFRAAKPYKMRIWRNR
ncbi:hypothetical protein F5Y11DRAFT_349166 [Daldinia sp. FL1419]|nr:hypothetical protein F5Y11DRAFT_349166 [Daldinia sp. FL1419]